MASFSLWFGNDRPDWRVLEILNGGEFYRVESEVIGVYPFPDCSACKAPIFVSKADKAALAWAFTKDNPASVIRVLCPPAKKIFLG